MKVLPIAVAFTAILFVAHALPKPQIGEEEPGDETESPEEGEGGEGDIENPEETDACHEFQQECADNESHLGNGNGDHGGNNTMGNTTPSPQCHSLQEKCASQNNSTMPGGFTRPTNPETSTPSTLAQPTTVSIPTTPNIPSGRP